MLLYEWANRTTGEIFEVMANIVASNFQWTKKYGLTRFRGNTSRNKKLEAGTGDEAQASEKLDINYKGEDINIAFNPTFLTDGLTAINTAFVHISFTGANKPAVLTGQK